MPLARLAREAPAPRGGDLVSQRLPWSHARVLKASRRLNPTYKLIWLEHLALAHGDSGTAHISAKGLGARVGLARVTVERARQDFLHFGLITKHERGLGRTDDWTPCLPPTCRPTVQRLTDDDLERYAELLDAHLDSIARPAPTDEPLEPAGANLTHPMSELRDAGVETRRPGAEPQMSEPLTHSHE